MSAEPTEPAEKPDSTARQVFDHWTATMGKGARTALDAKRGGLIRARLRDGYTVDDLRAAVDGCKADPFSQGQNDRGLRYDDIALICRDAAHVDKFRALAPRAPSGPTKAKAGPPLIPDFFASPEAIAKADAEREARRLAREAAYQPTQESA